MAPQRETAFSVQAQSRMTDFNMEDSTAAGPRQGDEPEPRLVVRIRCSVSTSTEDHLVGRGTTRRYENRQAADAESVTTFPVEDPAVLRSEASCHAAVRRMLTKLPQLVELYGHRASEVELWDGCVPPGLVAAIVRDVAAGGAQRSYVCDVSMHVDFVSVYSEAKAMLLSCERAAARARAGADILAAGGEGQCAICVEELAEDDRRVTGLPGCSHAFHRGCILKWFQRAATCPSCRRDMMPYLYLPHMYHTLV
ncbi:unnamed protein product [Alopecurus aequalis]